MPWGDDLRAGAAEFVDGLALKIVKPILNADSHVAGTSGEQRQAQHFEGLTLMITEGRFRINERRYFFTKYTVKLM